MSTLFEQASLVMIPSGYKEDVVYSVKPTDGSGDLTFTRASDGTRVNSQGLVERVPWNLVQYSEQFDNAYWSLTNATITSNTTTAPNGTTTADTFTRTSGTGYIFKGSLSLGIGQYTQSVYAKADASSSIRLEFVTSAFVRGAACIFDLSNGTAGTITIYGGVSGFTASIESVGNGWYRCSLGGTITIADTYFYELSITSGSVYIWGAQLNEGTLKPYFPTTDRLNVPRLDYSNGCPSLLLEPQRTNLVTYSEQFDNAAYTKIDISVTANATTSPDGTQNAESILELATSGTHESWQRVSMTAGQVYAQSCFLKANGRNRVIMQIFDNTTQYASAIYDLSTGVVVASSGTATIQSMGNGWYRCTIAGSSPATGLGYCVLGLCENTYTNSLVMPSYSGDTAKGVYWWGFQLEAGSYPTSYIPTTSASVTRVADVYSRSLSSIASGTAYINITDNVALGAPGTHVYGPFAITSASLGLYLARPNGQRLRLWTAAANNVFQTTVTNLKLAITWDGTNINVYQNGVKVVTNYSYAITNVNNLFSSTNIESSATIAEIALFNSVLTDAECISLTS